MENKKKYFKNGTLKSVEFFIEGIPEKKHYFFNEMDLYM
jgi:hypothetical protein